MPGPKSRTENSACRVVVGCGDGPESVNAELAPALGQISWSLDSGSYKVVFLVGDAPPHTDYRDEVQYPATLARANELGIVVNTIRCGNDPSTEAQWPRIAGLTHGQYFTDEQAGGAVAMVTPFDAEMAALSAELDGPRLYYGNEETKARASAKVAATAKLHAAASESSRARRAAFNAMASGRKNLFGAAGNICTNRS